MADLTPLPCRPAPLAITMGEPAGIGPEITAHAWKALRHTDTCFFVIADPALFDTFAIDIVRIDIPAHAGRHFHDALPVIPLENALAVTPGHAVPENAAGITESIQRAVTFALDGNASGIVTAPVNKSSLMEAGFPFPGHTEYLDHLTRNATGTGRRSRHGIAMMLTSPVLKTMPVTIHTSVKDAAAALDTGMIVRTGMIAAECLAGDFGIDNPRLAVSGLNPHAGESGRLGTEDETVIMPAVETLVRAGIRARGPLPADTMFHEEARATYDAALCMLHDQALIPVKTLAFHTAVNMTPGLPVIRTSPDHGTALDIAGKGKARPDSLICAITLAEQIARKRLRDRQAAT